VDFDEILKPERSLYFVTATDQHKARAEQIRAQLLEIFQQTGREGIVVQLMIDTSLLFVYDQIRSTVGRELSL
jgi:hypothetical protein